MCVNCQHYITNNYSKIFLPNNFVIIRYPYTLGVLCLCFKICIYYIFLSSFRIKAKFYVLYYNYLKNILNIKDIICSNKLCYDRKNSSMFPYQWYFTLVFTWCEISQQQKSYYILCFYLVSIKNVFDCNLWEKIWPAVT